MAQRLLASSEEVELIAADGEQANVPALHGWRRQVFGEAALKVRAGELALVDQGPQAGAVAHGRHQGAGGRLRGPHPPLRKHAVDRPT